jgi:hypothetical protein
MCRHSGTDNSLFPRVPSARCGRDTRITRELRGTFYIHPNGLGVTASETPFFGALRCLDEYSSDAICLPSAKRDCRTLEHLRLSTGRYSTIGFASDFSQVRCHRASVDRAEGPSACPEKRHSMKPLKGFILPTVNHQRSSRSLRARIASQVAQKEKPIPPPPKPNPPPPPPKPIPGGPKPGGPRPGPIICCCCCASTALRSRSAT